jgi:predicted amidophosphoribosyltransferase
MLNPAEVQGAWQRGWTLDVHTTASEFLGYDPHGHPRFSTTRSPLGELVFQLKYRGDEQAADQVARVMADFIANKPNALARIMLIVPMPASIKRPKQPVAEIARRLAPILNKPMLPNVVTKTRETPGIKDVDDPASRRELLDGAFEADRPSVAGKCVLLVDDLYRSGATANAVTLALVRAGASAVYFLAATRTKGAA